MGTPDATFSLVMWYNASNSETFYIPDVAVMTYDL